MTAFTSYDNLAPVWVSKLMDDLHLTEFQAAGLLGNLGYESNGFRSMQEVKPTVPGSRGGYGVAQWTGQRRRAFEAWCKSHKLAPATVEANYGYLVEELKSEPWEGFTGRLRRTATIEEACRLVHKEFENPRDVQDGTYASGPARLSYAQRAIRGTLPPPSRVEVDAALLDLHDAVMRAQRLLKARGHYHGNIDGDFGLASRNALLEYRRSK